MKLHFLFLFMLWSGLLLGQETVLYGVVLDQSPLGNPLPNVTISVSGRSFVTTDQGEFMLPLTGFKEGQFVNLILYRKDLGTNEEKVPIRTDSKSNPYVIKIDGSSSILITGTITDKKNGKAIENAEVTILSSYYVREPPVAKTDKFGTFKLYLNRNSLTRIVDYIELIVRSPERKYRQFNEALNISAPVKIELEKRRVEPQRYQLPATYNGSVYLEIVHLRNGNLVTVNISNRIRIGEWVGYTGPNGKNSGVGGITLENFNIVRHLPHAAVLYRFSNQDEWKFCGEKLEFTAQSSGVITLELMINDNDKTDNEGAFDVEVIVED